MFSSKPHASKVYLGIILHQKHKKNRSETNKLYTHASVSSPSPPAFLDHHVLSPTSNSGAFFPHLTACV